MMSPRRESVYHIYWSVSRNFVLKLRLQIKGLNYTHSIDLHIIIHMTVTYALINTVVRRVRVPLCFSLLALVTDSEELLTDVL